MSEKKPTYYSIKMSDLIRDTQWRVDYIARDAAIREITGKHYGLIDTLCGAALGVGILPQIMPWNPLYLKHSVLIGRCRFIIENGEMTDEFTETSDDPY